MLVFSILIVNLANRLHRLNHSLYNFFHHNFAFIQNLSHKTVTKTPILSTNNLISIFTIQVGSEQMIYSYNFFLNLS